MSDARLRQLERHGGTVAEEAALLQERVRAGELTRARVKLAAYVGYEPAREVVGAAPPRLPLGKWVGELQPRFGVEALRRAALAAAACALEHWEGVELEQETRESWEDAARFTRCPCEPHRPQWPMIGHGRKPRTYQLWLRLLGIYWPPRNVETVFEARWRLKRVLGEGEAEPLLRQWIRDQLSAWALGGEDPLLVGWSSPVSFLSREELAQRTQALQHELADRPEWAYQPEFFASLEPQRIVLDPEFFANLESMSVTEAVARAFDFHACESDTDELSARTELYSRELRTRDGVLHDFDWYFATGWRELWPEPKPVPAVAGDFDFNA